ncbi:MAG: crossover junction endodeoxyribonuclease RuvC [Desulfuromonadaceae bacterium]|nr:crossover junction endodeoxyribonuclease RuvC [Desulfuromonadaceae bacterium]
MRILGVDPGTLITGFGFIEAQGSRLVHIDHGTVHTSSRTCLAERLAAIYEELCRVVRESSPDALAVEKVFVAANVASAMKLCHARGIVLLAGARHQIPVFEYSALQVKSSVVGYGKASKNQVQQMTRMILKLPATAPADAADALAVAICHAHSHSLQDKLSRIAASSAKGLPPP